RQFLFLLFFFSSRRRHTRSKRDWSSDVCSSDLLTYLNQKCIKKREALSRFFIYAVCSSSSTNTDNAKISATSIVLTSCSTSFAFVPSLNIVRQNGQALEIIVGSVSNNCSVRATLIRFPVVSSVHIKPPPAP